LTRFGNLKCRPAPGTCTIPSTRTAGSALSAAVATSAGPKAAVAIVGIISYELQNDYQALSQGTQHAGALAFATLPSHAARLFPLRPYS
jgi:hypothetical protein